ncbi:MAG TPA: alkaline phosphatase [Methanomassiliicoccales archaeon]
MNRMVTVMVVAMLLGAALFMMLVPTSTAANKGNDQKNVIMMIPDGCGSQETTLARWYNGGSLALDSMPSGLIRTYGADSIITDSAPAATAFATGYKTDDKYVGVLPGTVTVSGVAVPLAGMSYSPVASVLEAAKAKGMSVGLIATSNIQHATPAGFSAHWPARSDYNTIAEQQVYEDIDVVFGGGSQYLLPKSDGGVRTDGENLINVLESRGYSYVDTKTEMASLNTNQVNKVWGLFAADAMAKDIDRSLPQFQNEPSLAEMAQKAIDILSKNPKGFFLMVEGSQVDWSSHANDPVGVVTEVIAFDHAVSVAKNFAEKNRNTLILAFTDHETGGMSIGSIQTDSTYSSLPLTQVLTPTFMSAKLTGAGLYYALPENPTDQQVRDIVKSNYGISDLTDAEVSAIKTSRASTTDSMDYVVGPMISKRCDIGWTTVGHTGMDVTLYSYGKNRPVGLFENTQLAQIAADAMGVSLECTTKNLFVDANATFTKMGATVSKDNSDPTNPVLVVEKAGVGTMRLPYAKDIAILNGKTCLMNGITVSSSKTDKVWISMEAVNLFNGKRISSFHDASTSTVPLSALVMDYHVGPIDLRNILPSLC